MSNYSTPKTLNDIEMETDEVLHAMQSSGTVEEIKEVEEPPKKKRRRKKRVINTFIIKTSGGIFSVQAHGWNKKNGGIDFMMASINGTLIASRCVVASFKNYEYLYLAKSVKFLTDDTLIEISEPDKSLNSIEDLEV